MLQTILTRDGGYILRELMPAFNDMRCEVIDIEDGKVVGVHPNAQYEILEREGYFFIGKRKDKSPLEGLL